MSEKHITRVSAAELNMLKDKTDYERLRNLTDEDIAAAVADDPDAAPIDLDWSDAEVIIPPAKTAISIRVDADVLDYFKATGQGYQTRINAVLRRYMDRQKAKAG
ncbi:MAG: BrnA antitoxin family protein [Hyphomicrobiales bacterium]|nr:BrnA antitoxin family protein [Hyphomicrobiales bacterium]